MILNNLPDLDFCDKSAESVETSVIAEYESISGRELYPGDPLRLFLEGVASVIAQQRVLIDFSAKQNLLAYSSGDYLDHLGALLGVVRLPAYKAETTLEFSLSQARSQAVLIPAGTRVTGGGEMIFETLSDCQISPGEINTSIRARALLSGARGNGYAAGTLINLVDPLPYVDVRNSTISAGGADEESDDGFRQRIQLAPESFSVAGPTGAYRFWASTAHQDITDVAVYSPEPVMEDPDTWGSVRIYPLMKDGELPSQEVLASVEKICSSDEIRPTSDRVVALSPEVVEYSLKATYWIDRSVISSKEVQIRVESALEEYFLWQRSILGRDLNPTELVYLLRTAGAKRVEVIEPQFRVLKPWEVAHESASIELTFGGLEDG